MTSTITRPDEAVRGLVAALDAAQSDVTAFCDLLTEDVSIVNFFGRRVQGRVAFHAAMTEAMRGELGQITTRTEIHAVTLLADGVAQVSATKHVADGRTGAYTITATLTADGWRACALQTTPQVAP